MDEIKLTSCNEVVTPDDISHQKQTNKKTSLKKMCETLDANESRESRESTKPRESRYYFNTEGATPTPTHTHTHTHTSTRIFPYFKLACSLPPYHYLHSNSYTSSGGYTTGSSNGPDILPKYIKQIYSAGILPFYVKNNNTYILLGKDREGFWSDFGGRSEGQDQGRWDITAIREFYEESVGSIMEIPMMMSLLQNKKNTLKIKGKTLNKSPYFMYFVKIPFKDYYRENFKSTIKFINYAKMFDKKFNEKSDIQWVSLETMCVSLDRESSDAINYPLREVFRETFETNLEQIKHFGSKFYEHKMIMVKKL